MYRAERYGLKKVWGQKQLRQILVSSVQAWVKEKAGDGMKPRTIEARLRALQTVLAGQRGVPALRDRLISVNPCAGIDLPTKPEIEVEIYQPDEVDALIHALDPWWVPIIALAVDLGLRWGELMGLQLEDFGLGCTTVTIRRTIIETTTAKSGNGTRFKIKDYQALRDRGMSHHAAMRQLANRLVGILHGCLKTRTHYDEHTAWAHHIRKAA